MIVEIIAWTIVVLAFISLVKVKKPMKTLYIIRGIPGSGKSTLAAKMAIDYNTDYTETDQFLHNDQGDYEWTQDRLSRAMDLNYEAVFNRIAAGVPCVITAGCYSRWRAMRDYVELAQANKYQVVIIQCNGNYGSVHGLTAERMEQLSQRFIPNTGLPQLQDIKYEQYP